MEDFLNFIVNYFIHAFILFTFLSIFFIFYITKLTKKAFVEEITKLIESAMSSIKMPFNWKNLDSFNLSKLAEIYLKPDQTIEMYNGLLINALIIVNIIMWIGLIVIISILKFYNWEHLDLSVILLENFLIFIFIGIIEFLFFTQIAFKYVPIKPSFMKTQLLHNIQNS